MRGCTLGSSAGIADIPANAPPVVRELTERTGLHDFTIQPTVDGITTIWIPKQSLRGILRYLKSQAISPYALLFDLTAIDERLRCHRQGLPGSEFTVVYHLLSFERNEDIRIKIALFETSLLLPTISDIWPSANWYEREVYDMFGITFSGHPDLRRLLMWEQYKEGFPLRKDFPLRGRFSRSEQLRQALAANPEARYSKEELSIADAFEDLPDDMVRRITGGERTGE